MMDISLWQFVVGAAAWTFLLAIVMWCGFHYTVGDDDDSNGVSNRHDDSNDTVEPYQNGTVPPTSGTGFAVAVKGGTFGTILDGRMIPDGGSVPVGEDR